MKKKRNFFQSLLKSINPDVDEKDERLFETVKNTEPGHNHVFKPDSVYQADTTHWGTDGGGFRYILGVVDTLTGAVDAEPLKVKTAQNYLKAFETIFNRGILTRNFKILQVDHGSEFDNHIIKDYFLKMNVVMRFGRVNRSNQQGKIEWVNGVLGKNLVKNQNLRELKSKARNSTWVKYLRPLIDEFNTFKHEPKKIIDFFKPVKPPEDKKPLLKIGTRVHVILEHPTDVVTGKRLKGNFRAGELRYSKGLHKIENILLLPNSYPRYILSDIPYSSFSRSELIVD